MFFPAPDERLWVGVLRLGLLVPGSRSLKDKRRAILQIRDRLQARHHVAVAEVGHLDNPLRGVVSVSCTGNDPQVLRSTLDHLLHEIRSWSMALVDESDVAILRPWDSGNTAGYEDDDG